MAGSDKTRRSNATASNCVELGRAAAAAAKLSVCIAASLLGRIMTRRLHFTARCTTGCITSWMNYANESSQAALERSSQDVYDVTSSQQGGCADSRRCGAFDRMNIRNISSTQPAVQYNRLFNRLHRSCIRSLTGRDSRTCLEPRGAVYWAR